MRNLTERVPLLLLVVELLLSLSQCSILTQRRAAQKDYNFMVVKSEWLPSKEMKVTATSIGVEDAPYFSATTQVAVNQPPGKIVVCDGVFGKHD
jgi:hypothetical protein